MGHLELWKGSRIQSNADWSVLVYYWVLSAGFAIVEFFAFRLQDGMTRYFSAHEALDIAEAVLFAELMTFAVLFTLTRLDGIPRSIPLVHFAAGGWAPRSKSLRAYRGQRRQ